MLRKIITLSILLLSISVFSQKTMYKMLVGTFTNGKAEGIYSLSFNSQGKLLTKTLLAKTDNPSFMTFSTDKKCVYAVNETKDNSAVTAYSFDIKNNSLTILNRISLGNSGPCYVTSTEKHVIIGNYGNGTISVLERKTDGSLTDTVQTIKHVGKMFGRGKFGPSNVHQTLFSPNGKYLIVNNLGKDCIFSYAYNENGGNEVLQETDVKILEKHSGPRHSVFAKNGKLIYMLQELNVGIKVLELSDEGKLNVIQEINIKKDSVENSGADIHLSPDEKYLYVTNRGDVNEITCFKVEKNGKLTKQNAYSTQGNKPRNFAISPNGKFVFVGNQKTDNITIFSRNIRNGKLKLVSKNTELGAPVCLLFY